MQYECERRRRRRRRHLPSPSVSRGIKESGGIDGAAGKEGRKEVSEELHKTTGEFESLMTRAQTPRWRP